MKKATKVFYAGDVPEKLKTMQVQFASHIRDPKRNHPPAGIEERRLKVYRELFYSSISSMLEGSFPIINEILDEKEWEDLIRAFYKAENNHTPHFPEISREFVQFLKKGYVIEGKPYLADFAHYEWVELAVDIDTRELNKCKNLFSTDLLEGIIIISPLVRLNAYRYPVHQISKDFEPKEELDEEIYICVYRDQYDDVKFMQLNNLSAFLLDSLQNNTTKTTNQVLHEIAKESKVEDIPGFVSFGIELLEDWYNKDIITNIK